MAAGGESANDIGNGALPSDTPVTTLSISDRAAVFLKHDSCVTPSTTTHKYCAVTEITGGKAYGLYMPSGWAAPFGAYLIVNTVKYDANGGTGTIDDFIQGAGTTGALSDGSGFSLPYYHVTGWNTNPAGGGTAYAGGGDYFFYADAKLYAQWAINKYTVKYDANGGKGTTTSSSHTCNAAKTLTTNGFTRVGYTFGGWAAASDGAAVYSDGESVTNLSSTDKDTVTLFAKWIPNTYAVKYDANGGTGTMADNSYTYDVSKALTSNAFSRTGYTFAGWATAADGSVVYSDEESVTNLSSTDDDTVTLFASWAANDYTVKYDANGGTGTMTDVSHTYDVSKALTSNAFSRTDYTFAGWAASTSGAVVYADEQSVSNLTTTNGATVTLYAKWTAVPTLASSVAGGKIYTGGRITLTPNIAGGTWTFDGAYLSRHGDTFTALKTGTSTVTYTVGGVSASYTVTINAAVLPETGQSFIWIWILGAAAALLLCAAGVLVRRRLNAALKR